MKNTVNILVFCTYIFLCASLESSAASKEIRVGIYDNKPLIFMAESGPQGIYIDVLENIAKTEGWNLQYRQGTWNDVFTLLTRNEIDILPVVAFTESRLTQLDFCEQTLISNWGQVYAKKNLSMESIQNLEGKKIATLSHDTHGEYFKTLLAQLGISYETVLIENYAELFQALESGKADAGVVNYLAARNYAENYELQSTPIVFNPIQIRYAVPKGDPAGLLTAMDRHITNFKADKNSVYHTSMAHWFGAESPSFQLPGWIKWVFIILSGVLIVLVTGNIILRVQVKAKTKSLLIELKNRELAENVLRESEELLARSQELAHIGSWKLDLIKNRLTWSDELYRIFGCDPQEFAATYEAFLDAVHSDDREMVNNAYYNSIQERLNEYEIQHRIVRRNTGEIRIVHERCIHERNEAGTIFRSVGMTQDITELKQADTEREKLQEQLGQAQKMESVGRLAGGVAHDFNNMLGVILGHLEFAMDEIEEDHNLYSDLKEIQTAAKRSAALTKQLLTFARKQVISPIRLDVNDTVESMLNMLRRLIGENIDLIWKPAAYLWPVKMDPTQIDQVLANLCVNARDAIAGVGRITIETGRKSFDEEYCRQHSGFIPGNFVLLAVNDNGCGMDKDTLKNLFEPFFTTKEVGKGTGLGLATVYGIVKQNNGFINVYSEPGMGSNFKIYLPQLVVTEDNAKADSEKKAAAGGTETILLVEDEPTILRMTSMMLERKGYTVLSAGTPTEAVEKAKRYSDAIALLITDVVMPEMNGRDLSGQITDLYPDIRLLFMSGYTANVIAHHGVLDKGVAFIQKPFSMVDLTEKVREVLDMAPDKNQTG